MSILIARTGDDEGQFHLMRPLSEDEEQALNRISNEWSYDGDGDWLDGEPSEDFRIWIDGPMDAALLPAIAAFLEGLPA
jgi:hypothetical protein